MIMPRIGVLTTAAFLMGAAGVAAQACLGLPTRDGDIAVAASYAASNGVSEVGGDFHADVSGPGSLGFAYRTGTDDSPGSSYEVRGAYDLYLIEPAVCGVAGVRFTDRTAVTGAERLAVPVGLGIGKTMRGDRLTATVYAIPQYMWVREDRSAPGIEDEDTSHEFTGEAGVTLGLRPLFVNGAITLDTLDDDPAFRVRVGVIF